MSAARARRLAAGLALAAALALGPAGTGPAAAEVRRLEVVGAVPAGPQAPRDVPARQAALQQALEEAVERVARELLAEGSGREPGPRALEEALGKRSVEHTVRYRVLEDRGERRALLVREPGVSREYVVVAEVFVDRARVAESLRRAGLLRADRLSSRLRTLRVEVEGSGSWEAYAGLRRALLEAGGAEWVVPERLEAGRALLRVRVAADAATLSDRLARAEPEGLRLRVLSREEGRLRLRAIDTRAPNRY